MKDIEQKVYEMMCYGCEKEHLCHEKCITCEEFKEEVKKQQKRYIRTKDENNLIIDMSNMQLAYNLTDEYIDFNYFGRFKIVNQADTIEELCDEFVMKTLLTYYENTHLKDLLLEYDKFHIKDGITIYGAIWTDKGLIYVAKMNGEGELELL